MFDLTFAIILCAYNIQCIIYYIEWAKAISINLLLLYAEMGSNEYLYCK